MKRKVRPALVALFIGMLASCVPWTVRPIDSKNQPASGRTVSTSPAEYVDSIWASKLVPSVMSSAVEARELLNAMAASPANAKSRYGRGPANGASYYIVKGNGKVTAIDTRSRVGVALVDVAPFDQSPDVSIQIGPVIRGTSLRDATGIFGFSDFVNQLQFADAGNEINNRILTAVLGPLDLPRLKGQFVFFAGTVPVQANAVPLLADLVPVVLTVEERP